MLLAPPPDLSQHRRIVLHGVTGSGKSSMAVRLAAVGGMPHIAVDDLMWRPGWVQLSAPDQVEAIRPLAQDPAWVMDALWRSTREVVLPRTDLVVALDYPRRVSLGRLLTRTVHRLREREQICGGNTESWRQTLSRASIVAWHFRTFERKRQEIAQWAAAADGPPLLRFTDPRAAEAWLRALEHDAA